MNNLTLRLPWQHIAYVLTQDFLITYTDGVGDTLALSPYNTY